MKNQGNISIPQAFLILNYSFLFDLVKQLLKYDFYYLIGDTDNAQIYNSLKGFVIEHIPTSSNKSCISIVNNTNNT